jgi:hypothetical protein
MQRSRKMGIFLMVLVFFSVSISGCCYFSAKKEMNTAEKMLGDLKAKGGDKLVPYEYCSAEQFLENAKREANESDWNDAKNFAIRSKSASGAGLSQIQNKK